MNAINPEMIVLAREIRGFTQKELAEHINISQGMLSKIEKGLFKPSEDFLLSIYDFLNFPISFFEQKDQLFDPNLTFYRKRVTVKKITQLSAEGRMNLVRMHVERLMKSVELPELNLPTWDVEEQGEPTNAAIWLRRSWGLPKGRIENLTKVVEDNGIVVISFNFGTEKMDGLSMQTKDKQPLIFINKAISGDRQRFTLAHEVGHLVMHIGQRVSDFRDVEKEAMQFAAELLVPASEFQKEAEYISLESLGDLKRYWKVSMGSLLFRVKELGLVTENRYRYLWQQMAMKGYKTHEPAALNIPRETPTLMKEIIMMHINELGYKKDELSTMLNIIEADLEELYFNDQVKLKIVRN